MSTITVEMPEVFVDFKRTSRKVMGFLFRELVFVIRSSLRRVVKGSKLLLEGDKSSPILKQPKKAKTHASQKILISSLFKSSLLIANLSSLSRFGVTGNLTGEVDFWHRSNFFFPVKSCFTKSVCKLGGFKPRVRWYCLIPAK